MYTSVFESAIDKLNISDIHKNAIKQINKVCLEAIQYVNDVQLHRCLRIAKYVTTHRQPFSADEVDYAQKVLNVTNPSTLKAETDAKMVAMLNHLSGKEKDDYNKWRNEYENKQNIEKTRLGYNVDDSQWGADTKKAVRYVLAHKDEVPNDIVRLAENLSKRTIQGGDAEALQLRTAVMKSNTDIGKKFKAWVDRGEKDEEVKSPEQVQQAQQQTTQQTQNASEQGENVNGTNSKRTPKAYPIFSDEEMGALQKYLNSKGANLEVDKKIGPKTTWWLQKISGISTDYIWGPNTQKAYEDMKPKIQEFINVQNINNQQQQEENNQEQTQQDSKNIQELRAKAHNILLNVWREKKANGDDKLKNATELQMKKNALAKVKKWDKEQLENYIAKHSQDNNTQQSKPSNDTIKPQSNESELETPTTPSDKKAPTSRKQEFKIGINGVEGDDGVPFETAKKNYSHTFEANLRSLYSKKSKGYSEQLDKQIRKEFHTAIGEYAVRNTGDITNLLQHLIEMNGGEVKSEQMLYDQLQLAIRSSTKDYATYVKSYEAMKKEK